MMLDYSACVFSENAVQVMLSPLPKGGGGRRRDEMVEQYLLEKITSGELPVGTKLPPTSEMSVQMQVNVNSMQKALMRLSARGFLARKTNLGTFVCPRDLAPQNILLLVGPCLRDEWCHFDRRLSKLIEAELFSRGYNPILYDGLDQSLDHTSTAGPRLMSQLLADFTHFDPKGIVEQGFVSLRLPELARDGKRPIVSFRPLAQGGDVAFDSAHFYTEAVRATVERGRKNAIFVLKNPKISFDSRDLQAFWSATRTHGLNVVKVLHIDDDHAEGVREHALEDLLTRELQDWKKLPPSKRWDSLILRDDIQMRTAAQCLLREGFSVPHDIMPVSSVNEGIDLNFGIPTVGIEMPLAQAASSLVDILDIRLGRSTASDSAPISLQGRIVDVGRQATPIPQRLEPASSPVLVNQNSFKAETC